MDISKLVYIIFLIIACILVYSGFKKPKAAGRNNRIKKMKPVDYVMEVINKLSYLAPQKGSKIYNFYKDFIKHTRLSVEDLFKVKYLVVILTLIIILLVKYTNTAIYTKEIFNKFDYYTDLLNQFKGEVLDEQEALKQEIYYLNTALKEISKNELNQAAKEDIQSRIKSLIKEADAELYIPRDTIANKVYYRLTDYYKYREHNIPIYLLIVLIVFFIPDLWVLVYNYFSKVDAKKELRFLKKLIIVNGSIKPVDFMELLGILIDKSKYYKKTLQDIENLNKKNTVDNREIYSSHIKNVKDLNTKLFFEKLDQANNYDFDQAIMNINNEFKLEKREQIRHIRKQISIINIVGITGYMILIVILIMYLLVPWLRAYNMNQII